MDHTAAATLEHAHTFEPEPVTGIPHDKMGMWVFLCSEVMFFTGLIGTYIVLRNGTPTTANPWPKPHDVHLLEWIGAFNTFPAALSAQ